MKDRERSGRRERMRRPRLAVTLLDNQIEDLVRRTDRRTVGEWAADCAERVLPLFEGRYPGDPRPRQAIESLREWVRTGEFRMADVRGASLGAHAAARQVENDDAARSAARAAGQAMASAHVPAHARAAARYAAAAVRDAAGPEDADQAALDEAAWQLRRLVLLREERGNTR